MAELAPTQRRFLAALLESRTIAEAIRKANVSERSAYRWLKDEAFRAALEEAEARVLDEALRRLLNLQSKALDGLEAVLSDPQARHSDKLRAIDTILSHALRLREAAELERRISELEQKLAEVQDELGRSYSTD